MTPLTPENTPQRVFEPLFATSGSDDLSTHAHRQLIGWLGFLLPVLLWLMAGWRPTEGIERWEPLGSVSAYYYTGAVTAFVGVLVALAVFLFTYQGYNNEDRKRDRGFAIVAGVAAIGVAMFPTRAPEGVLAPSWWTPVTDAIHYVSAVALFASFIVFSLYLFRKSNVGKYELMPADKVKRNRVYVFCGAGMIGCMLWAGGAALADAPIFWPETLALEFFAVSWLAKGRAVWTLDQAGKRTRDYVRRRRRAI